MRYRVNETTYSGKQATFSESKEYPSSELSYQYAVITDAETRAYTIKPWKVLHRHIRVITRPEI